MRSNSAAGAGVFTGVNIIVGAVGVPVGVGGAGDAVPGAGGGGLLGGAVGLGDRLGVILVRRVDGIIKTNAVERDC